MFLQFRFSFFFLTEQLLVTLLNCREGLFHFHWSVWVANALFFTWPFFIFSNLPRAFAHVASTFAMLCSNCHMWKSYTCKRIEHFFAPDKVEETIKETNWAPTNIRNLFFFFFLVFLRVKFCEWNLLVQLGEMVKSHQAELDFRIAHALHRYHQLLRIVILLNQFTANIIVCDVRPLRSLSIDGRHGFSYRQEGLQKNGSQNQKKAADHLWWVAHRTLTRIVKSPRKRTVGSPVHNSLTNMPELTLLWTVP